MTKGDVHPNLRHRKHVTDAVQNEAGGMKEISPTCNTNFDNSYQPSFPSSSSSLSQTDGYVLIPLIERSLLMRLDVGPFLVAYMALVFLDSYVPVDNVERSWISTITLVAFPLFLLLHVGLFLLQQWDVAWRASVGYEKLDPLRYKSRSRKSPNHIKDTTFHKCTHCLVEAAHVDKHDASHGAGIVLITQLRPVSNGSNEIVMTVNFQDIVFRCNPSDDREDYDDSIWTSNGEKSTARQEDITAQSNGFHRLRYPIHYPLSFYKQWKGHTCMKQLLLAQQTYGNNTTIVELPPFIKLLQEQVLAPFFLFQLLCVLLWSLDEYWYYAMFTLFALLLFESTVAYNRLKSLERLRSHTIHTPTLIWAYRPTYPPGINGWVQISVVELVPGDVVSCKHVNLVVPRRRHHESNLPHKQQQLNRIPADILILSGDAVVDESLLTGESIPQLKVPIETEGSANSLQSELDLQEHRQSVLFGGTTLVVGRSGNSHLAGLPDSPDSGLVGMVLRTGFETAQGTLLRTMAHTQKSVDGIHTRDTYVFILLLLCCAVASAALVWGEGRNDPTRNLFRLSLHVIIIITSVVPPELPMELSLAVTNSVADLMKRKIFCTEAFRIPLAGQVNFCCFDKTGTLTSDQMQLKGLRIVLTDPNSETNNKRLTFSDLLKPELPMPWPVSRIMVACHSLAMNSQSNNNIAASQDEGVLSLVGDPLEKAVLEATGYRMKQSSVLMKVSECSGPDEILIRHRFGFSSRLKRMSVLATETGSDITWVLTKGAPETLKPFLRSNTVPRNYDEVSMLHMALGQRVLAIAYRELNSTECLLPMSKLDRLSVESELIFAGFLLLHSPIKHDSKAIVTELKSSGHNVVMITGDAVLTAVEVSRMVGIIPKTQRVLTPTYQLMYEPAVCAKPDDCSMANFKFVSLFNTRTPDHTLDLALDSSGVARLKGMVQRNEVALCISGDMLQKLVTVAASQNKFSFAMEKQGKDEKQTLFHPCAQTLLKEIVPLITVFARHAPRQKEAIIAALNLGGQKTLMCGDGTNDTMALRRSHVGISLINAPEVEAKQTKAVQSISMAMAELKKGSKHIKKRAPNKETKSSLEESLRQLQEAQDELDQIDLGDASVASPFTSRVVNISCCKEVLRQGRCTLVTMLQIYKILGVNCLVNATILSKLFLYGVKQGDRQMTFLGLLVAALFFFVTRGKPLSKLSAVRPPTSVLCTQALLSISSQFLIHFAVMTIATEVALAFVDPFDPSLIPDGPFNQNTLNSCTFLISVLATVNTFAVNYRGEPFVEPLRKNQMLWRSIQASYMLLFACVFEVFPPLNDLFQLAEFPDVTDMDAIWTKEHKQSPKFLVPLMQGLTTAIRRVGFPVFMFALMIIDTILAFLTEQIILHLFAWT
jgi:manganese-transporting P-type ATPase